MGTSRTDSESARAWTLVVFGFVFAEAVAMQARGPILASLERSFDVSAAALGLVAPVGTIGFFVAILATGLLAGRLDVRRTLLLGILCVIAGLLVMAAAPLYVVFLLGLFVQGTASGAFRGADRMVLSHLHAERRSRVYAAYTLVWAVGAVLGPQVVTLVVAVLDWRAVFLVVALCFVPTAVLAARSRLPSLDGERSLSLPELRGLLGRPPVVGACTGMVLVGSIEGVLFTWLAYYAAGFYATTTANLLLSVYLLAYVPARLGYAYAIDRVPALALLAAVTVPVIPALAVAFSGVTGPAFFAAVFVAGAGVAGGYPVLSAYAAEAAPAYSGPLNGLTNGAAYVGMAIAPALVGVLAGTHGIGRALWVAVAAAGGLLVVTVATWRWTGTADTPTQAIAAD